MFDKLQWIEGEFLALESLRQGGENWTFPKPPRSLGAAEPANPAGASVRRVEAPSQSATDQDGQEQKREPTSRPQASRPQAKLFRD